MYKCVIDAKCIVEYNSPKLNSPLSLLAFANKLPRTRELLDGWKGVGAGGWGWGWRPRPVLTEENNYKNPKFTIL